jgi:lipopolysaccharide/colanic/teichoic acid biosynthesis glycosyltransferase
VAEQTSAAWGGAHAIDLELEARRLKGSLRRAAGRLAALVLLLVVTPLLLVIAVAVRLTSPGPVLFRQRRLGLLRQPFTMLKFRTMVQDNDDRIHREYVAQLLTGDADDGGEEGVYKLVGDPRVTWVGRILRRTSLDELPQLINVVRGDMALVGPRPVLEYEAELFPSWAALRFRVRPGITGLWQVSGRSTVDYRGALAFDVDYVRRRSLLLDLSILLRTFGVLVGRSVAR